MTTAAQMGSAFDWWYESKLFIERAIAISHDALHIIVGILLFFLLALVLRRPVSSWTPWLALLAVLTVNEFGDFWADPWPHVGMQLGEAAKDVILTMLVPALLLGVARFSPALFAGPSASRAAADGSSPLDRSDLPPELPNLESDSGQQQELGQVDEARP